MSTSGARAVYRVRNFEPRPLRLFDDFENNWKCFTDAKHAQRTLLHTSDWPVMHKDFDVDDDVDDGGRGYGVGITGIAIACTLHIDLIVMTHDCLFSVHTK